MMKKVFIFLIIFISTIFLNVNAKCDYKKQVDLASDAANIVVKYEAVKKKLNNSMYKCDEGDKCDFEIDYFKVYILNLNDNFTITVENDFNSDKKTFTSKDADESGIVSFDWMNVSKVTNFTFQVYATDKTECGKDHLRTIYFLTPKKNEYYDYDLCDGNEDLYVCQKFITTNEISYNEFYKTIKDNEVKKEEELKNKTFFDKTVDFIKEYKVGLICCGAAVVIIAFGVVIVVRKRNKIWK